MAKRSYRMTRRAESREETRARILAATIALHEELGPKATTISAIAERAGVQRLTVYRHFPDEDALLQACSSGWAALHPAPRPDSVTGSGADACRAGLLALYAYYSGTSRMWASIHRDEAEVAGLQGRMRGFRVYLARYVDALLASLRPARPKSESATMTLRHAVRFETWASLHDLNLSDAAKADLVISWLR
jgi:AcrR family transcriptional regulator